jgi:UPF0271 protein
MTANTESCPKKVVVLDTSALIAGFDPFSLDGEEYTVPMVKEEIAESSMPQVRFETAVASGKLKVKVPNEEFVNRAKASATLLGDKFFLSQTDLQLLALSLQLKAEGYSPMIATDDYSIQNVADQLGVEFASLATFGIRVRLTWIRYCPACRRTYSADSKVKTCVVCGTKLKRKPFRSSKLSQNLSQNINNERST